VRTKFITAAAIAFAFTSAGAEEKIPGFNQAMPEKIMMPETVETSIGTLNFVDGVPIAPTAQQLYDLLDFLRGVEVFLHFVPVTSLEAIRLDSVDRGATKSSQVLLFDQRGDSNPLIPTVSPDPVYCFGFLDLEADGPTVVEIPPGCGPGTVDDAYFRFVVDLGAPGPDRGRGGKYLIVPSSYQGELPKDKTDGGEYFIARSLSKVNWIALRGFLQDGKPDASSKTFRNGLKIYSLAQAATPPAMEFINCSNVSFNDVQANNFEFYHELDAVIQREPLDCFDPEMRGLAASIGIVKGRAFAPDDRMKKILTDAVTVGSATARAITFRHRDPRAPIFKNNRWTTGFIANDHPRLDGDEMAGFNLDARTCLFYMATVNAPKIEAKIPGRDSQYAVNWLDAPPDAWFDRQWPPGEIDWVK
jgi:hypothetical protein